MLHPAVALALSLIAMTPSPSQTTVRIATFNVQELSRPKLDAVNERGEGIHPQLRKAAEIVQRVRPDVLLINEIDYDAATRQNAARFLDRYLKVGQNGQPPVDYPHVFFEAVNTGVPTGRDLDHDGQAAGPADAYGFGRYPGQYGMALYSRFPIDADAARTLQKFLWKDMPGNLMPDGREGRPAWYSPEEADLLRLSSKSHWDVPIRVGPAVVHVLAAHPTPPVFDGPEDRNGRRAFDEVRLWVDYITGGQAAAYITDDAGRRGGLPPGSLFVVLGDLNSDPIKDPRPYGAPAIWQLVNHSRVRDPAPGSPGALGPSPAGPPLFPERQTADFGRVDYVLPCKELTVLRSGVFWPAPSDPLRSLVDKPEPSSDHRLVWVDVALEREDADSGPRAIG